MQALLNKYQVEPSFDLAIKIANRAGKIDKYKGNALSYYEMAFQQPEFYDLSNFRQAQLYLGMVGTMMKAGRSGAACMKYVDLAKEACPEYPESYMIEAQLFQRAAGGFSSLLEGWAGNYRAVSKWRGRLAAVFLCVWCVSL